MSKDLDKFYTPSEKAISYIGKVDELYNLTSFDYIIEPSAGSGAFSKNLPNNTIALDLEPEHESIIKMNFFDYQFPKGRLVAIGNPPYGRRADLAKQFFNKCALYCDVIAFVLPRSMTRPSMHSNISTNFHLQYEENLEDFELPDGKYFYRKSVFQIWERDDFVVREKYKPETTHEDFNLHHANTWTATELKSQIVDICPIGIGQNSTKIKPSKELTRGSNWFIEPKKEYVIGLFKQMDFSWVGEQSSCAPSISKADIITEYKKIKSNG